MTSSTNLLLIFFFFLKKSESFVFLVEITDDLLVGQAFQFLSAGLDPMMVVTLSLIYDLALHPEIQERARQEVLKVVEKHNGYSYASLSDMTYVEQCIQGKVNYMFVISPLIVRDSR